MGHIVPLTLPRLGETMDEGRVVTWLISPGEAFNRGDVLLEVETDKTVVEVPALQSGRLVEIVAKEESMVEIDSVIARIEVEGEAATPVAVPVDEEKKTATEPAVSAPAERVEKISGLRASPRARRLADEEGIDLASLEGTGRGGRISGEDVARHAVGGMMQGAPMARSKSAKTLLIHGIFGDGSTFAAVSSALNRSGLICEAPDLPGHGSNETSVDGLNDVVESLSPYVENASTTFHLIGHSLGAALATRLASRYPKQVESLTLIAPVGLGTEINSSFLDGMSEARTLDALDRELEKLDGLTLSIELREALLKRLDEGRDTLRAIIRDVAAGGVQQIAIGADLFRLECPVTAIFGARDRIIPVSHALNAPANVAVHVVPDAGHMPHATAHQTVMSIIQRHLGG